MQFCVLFFFYRGFADSILECKECDSNLRVHPECLPVPVPQGDPFYPPINITTGRPFCLAFTRSMPGQLTLGEIVKSLKFTYSEKATQFCEIFLLLLTVCTVVKSKGKISQNFVAFSEYMNFKQKVMPWPKDHFDLLH